MKKIPVVRPVPKTRPQLQQGNKIPLPQFIENMSAVHGLDPVEARRQALMVQTGQTGLKP